MTVRKWGLVRLVGRADGGAMTNTTPDQAGSHPHHARRGSVGEANVERARLKRPNPIQWVWYAFGGGLPEGRREWGPHAVTAKTRSLRHLARSMVLIAPLVVGWSCRCRWACASQSC